MTISSLLTRWRTDPDTAPNISTWQTSPPRPARLLPFPDDLPAPLADSLRARGITQLYSHQHAAWIHARRGGNVTLATGTASGKTLAYNLPVLAGLLENPAQRALYLFPTKALAQDQLSGISTLLSALRQTSHTGHQSLAAAIYDGDTPQSQRPGIRKNARILLTNPDMLHTGILPHHTNWSEFFQHLKFVVIDEVHTYRGVFGSHVANVIRRLRRAAAFYGARPQFILASATIGNPAELAETLIEAPVSLIDEDGSARGERHFLIYNPPVIDPALGLRKSAMRESVRLGQDLLTHTVQGVLFARSRRSVEIVLSYLAPTSWESGGGAIRGYRSGYLPTQRREIERGLRDGSVRLVVATNALELGIDIGGLGAAILVGYPGAIASVRQQSGRAGRGDAPAVSALVATPDPLDQFLARHPEYLLGRSPEQALLNPNHPLILLNHLRCAMFELPFAANEGFGSLSDKLLREYLDFLTENRESHHSGGKYFWMSEAYPAASVSLRTASPETVLLQSVNEDSRPVVIGSVDRESAVWMAHPGALYLHEARQYFVQDLNLETLTATLVPVTLDYYTEPLRETSVQALSIIETLPAPAGERESGGDGRATKSYGELQVTTRVTGFRKRRWGTGENLSLEPLDLPPTDLQTTGYWLTISEELVEALTRDGLWSNTPNDYGPEWPAIRNAVRARDGHRCQVCGVAESGPRQHPGRREHDVHHKIPFRQFRDETGRIQRERANKMDNLVTLCPACHRQAEQNVRMRSGLAGLGYVLSQLAPLFLMCDPGDLGRHTDPQAAFAAGRPVVVLYDLVPAGIGFSQKLYEIHAELIVRSLELVSACPCEDGCPSCVGPAGENGMGGKQETLALLRALQ